MALNFSLIGFLMNYLLHSVLCVKKNERRVNVWIAIFQFVKIVKLSICRILDLEIIWLKITKRWCLSKKKLLILEKILDHQKCGIPNCKDLNLNNQFQQINCPEHQKLRKGLIWIQKLQKVILEYKPKQTVLDLNQKKT